jgi:hypothetical protein
MAEDILSTPGRQLVDEVTEDCGDPEALASAFDKIVHIELPNRGDSRACWSIASGHTGEAPSSSEPLLSRWRRILTALGDIVFPNRLAMAVITTTCVALVAMIIAAPLRNELELKWKTPSGSDGISTTTPEKAEPPALSPSPGLASLEREDVAALRSEKAVPDAPFHAERRVALVIGNANYKVANISLSDPRNDAQDISAVLTTLGFEVVTAIDATKRDMDFALQHFARLATDADSALFFYAGHAMQFQGRNFLMPTDAELEDEISFRYQTVGLEEVRAALDRANGVKIMILDASRNNPLADRLQKTIAGASRTVATTRGLARIDKTQGLVVAYATAADEVAQDRQGRNSPFTAALLKRLQEPGLEIGNVFRRVAVDVNTQTAGRQRPETYISTRSEYYLNQADRIAFDRIKDKDDVTALRDFVNKYPSSPHAIWARNRLELLERARRAREEEQRKAEAERVF